jgi:hypothetical protein
MLTDRLRHYENIHIPLWLVKDTCWMLEFKLLGTIMIVPTLFVSLLLAWKTRHHEEFPINLAICFWITANAYWMCSEFFGFVQYKNYAGFPFTLGILTVSWFYLKRYLTPTVKAS